MAEKEDFAIILDYLPYGYPSSGRMTPVAQAIGEKSLALLELSVLAVEPLELSEELRLLALSFLLSLLELSPELELLEPSDALAPSLLSDFAVRRFWPEGDLWSVAYQPEPLKMIPAGVSTLRRLFLLHSGQRLRGSSLKD